MKERETRFGVLGTPEGIQAGERARPTLSVAGLVESAKPVYYRGRKGLGVITPSRRFFLFTTAEDTRGVSVEIQTLAELRGNVVVNNEAVSAEPLPSWQGAAIERETAWFGRRRGDDEEE